MRTPLNSTGKVVADPFTQQCSFLKEGIRVEPAIIHYCGEWAEHPTYTIARLGLAQGKPLSAAAQTTIKLRHKAKVLRSKVRRKVKRMLGR